MIVVLCVIAGCAALAGMASVLAVLVLGLGLGGLLASTGFGALALVAGLWAGMLSFATPPPVPAAGA